MFGVGARTIDELATVGVLNDFTGTQDDISRELEALTSSQNVEDELNALKSGQPSAERKQLPGS